MVYIINYFDDTSSKTKTARIDADNEDEALAEFHKNHPFCEVIMCAPTADESETYYATTL
ncbi:MAG: hypothetical protein F9K23_15930 [Bacteroidetes bacterium]|nr:MAG: hypothetical protein F9K23_15930 [Bacteroidota bacterium]